MVENAIKKLFILVPSSIAGWVATWALLEPIGGLTTLFSKKWLFIVALLCVLCIWITSEYYVKIKKGKIPISANGKILYVTKIGLGVRGFMVGILFQLILPILFGGNLDNNQIVLDENILKLLQKGNVTPDDYKNLLLALEKEQNTKIDTSLQTEFAEIIKEMYEDLDSTSKIEINKFFFEGGIERRVDLAISSLVAGTNLLTVVKLFPKPDSITITDLSIFENQMKEIKATKGVIITRGAYSYEVLNRENQYLIDICSFKDARNRNWKEDVNIPVVLAKIMPDFRCQATFDARGKTVRIFNNDINSIRLSNDGGRTITSPIDVFIKKWNGKEIEFQYDKNSKLDLSTFGYKAQTIDGNWANLTSLIYVYRVRKSEWFAYLKPKEYKELINHSTGQTFTDILLIELF